MSRAPDAHGDIDEFLAFMAGQGAANLIAGRRGAGAEAIARFAALAPFPLPSLLLGYLREFGEHADGVILGGDGRARLADLLRFHAESPEEVPARSVVLCTPALDPALVLHADSGQVPAVYRAWRGGLDVAVAPSFAHHLYRRGWLCAHWPNREELTLRGQIADVARYARAIGLERLWFSGGVAECFDGGDAVLDLEQTGDVARIGVLGRLASARERYARAIVRKTGARWLGR